MRPAFCITTAFVHEQDAAVAAELGLLLYDDITRPRGDPLAFGSGLPVYVAMALAPTDPSDRGSERLDRLADRTLLVVVVGATAFMQGSAAVIDRLNQIADPAGGCHVLVVPAAEHWRREAARFAGPELLGRVGGGFVLQETVDQVLLKASEILADRQPRPNLIISHASSPRGDDDGVADAILASAATHRSLRHYFANVIASCDGASDTSDSHGGTECVLVAIRSDDFAARHACQQELIAAKRRGWPVVSVEVLSSGERRSSPYAGNARSLLWRSCAEQVVRAAIKEHLKLVHFRQFGKQVIARARLPVDTLLWGRPPELLDLAGGAMSQPGTSTVLHPDPQLPVIERELLRSLSPSLRLFTPSTAFQRCLGRRQDDATAGLSSPLEGVRVGLSVSDGSFEASPIGLTVHHLEDVSVQLVRSLVSSGAAIAYGGDFRLTHGVSFTPLLAETIAVYSQTAERPAERLHAYLSASVDVSNTGPSVDCRAHHMAHSPDMAKLAMLPPPSAQETLPAAMYHSDMRRVMTAQIEARVAVGGNAEPKSEDAGPGYSGRFPGIVEEVYRSLQLGQPVYLCGGLGGAAAQLVEVFSTPDQPPPPLTEAHHSTNRRFARVCWDIDHHPLRERLDLPLDLDEMAAWIGRFAARTVRTDAACLAWNGLSVTQNQTLWHSADPLVISSLVLEGLIRWRQQRVVAQGKRRIEVFRGDLTAVTAVDVIAVPVFDDVSPQGASAAIDRVTDAAVSRAHGKSHQLIGLHGSAVDANFLYVASLGSIADQKNSDQVAGSVREAAEGLAAQCVRHGFTTVAVVTFAGSTIAYRAAVEAMLQGLRSAAIDLTIQWVERDATKFDALVDILRQCDDLVVTTRAGSNPPPRWSEPPLLQLTVSLRADDRLSVYALPPAGTGIVSIHETTLSGSKLLALSAGTGPRGQSTPPQAELLARGRSLATLLLGENGEALLARCAEYGIAITHDLRGSRIPFEMLSHGSENHCPALRAGLHRRLAVAADRVSSLFSMPRHASKLRVGLVINPTGDLVGADSEAEALLRQLDPHRAEVDIEVLRGAEVTAAKLRDLLLRVDVLHYCGHAMFRSPAAGQSGLVLAGGEPFTSTDLAGLQRVPQIVFFNACQAGRVRGEVENHVQPFAFAELMLRSGVEAYLGTYWEVQDAAAAEFAATLYQSLANGHTLHQAVIIARQKLFAIGSCEWANYLLYGDGRFKLA